MLPTITGRPTATEYHDVPANESIAGSADAERGRTREDAPVSLPGGANDCEVCRLVMSVLALGQSADTGSTILAVEDNPGDRRLLEEAVRESAPRINLHTVASGDEAIEVLRQGIADECRSLPDLVLTDLHLPGRDGQAIVTAIRDDLGLQELPVLILSRSDGDGDVSRCYESGANAYLTKPDGFDELVSLVEAIEAAWIDPATRLDLGLPTVVADLDDEALPETAILPPEHDAS